ncbi:MAG: tetratricopeptide repeat protein, partial [Rhodopirellula bahusiensis]
MADPDDPKNENAAPPSKRSKTTVLSLAFVTMFTMVGFAYMFSIMAGGREIDAAQVLNLASAQYVAGNVVVAGDLAENSGLDQLNEEEMKLFPMQEFLIGAGAHARANQAVSPRDRHEQMEKALPHLQRAHDLGFPEGRDSEGHRMLGATLHAMGRHAKAAEHLKKAVEIDLTLRAELLPLLAR